MRWTYVVAMGEKADTAGMGDLVHRARSGDRQALGDLAQEVEGRLRVYIYRLTLDYELSEELCQQTLVKMCQSLVELRDVERFWSWLFRHAMGDVQHYIRDQSREHVARIAAFGADRLEASPGHDRQDGLSYASRMEVSEIVLDAMRQLQLVYRNVLTLRCFENLSYAEIAELMGCKELRARVLCYRARHALKALLARQGLGKEVLLTALGLFGLVTSQAKAASVGTVTASALSVGPLAATVGAMGTRGGMAAATSVAALVVGLTIEQWAMAVVVTVIACLSLVVGLYLEQW